MKESPPLDLDRRLREADSEELLSLLQEFADDLEVPQIRQALRNPFLTADGVKLLLEIPRLLSFYEVRRDLAMHPQTPEIEALRFVSGLYWRDLVRLGGEPRVRPSVRRAAELNLINRLPKLTEGEKMSIARSGSQAILTQLRQDPSPRVLTALLDNPRLTEAVLAPLVIRETTPPSTLTLIAEHRRWGSRHSLRVGLSRNPSTPLAVGMRLLPSLKKADLRAVANHPRLPQALRRRARTLLGDLA